jgi:hypothetical protein
MRLPSNSTTMEGLGGGHRRRGSLTAGFATAARLKHTADSWQSVCEPSRLLHILPCALVFGSRLDLPWVLLIAIVRDRGFAADAAWGWIERAAGIAGNLAASLGFQNGLNAHMHGKDANRTMPCVGRKI